MVANPTTAVSTPAADSTPTPDAAAAAIISAVQAGSQAVTQTYLSPDQRWQVELARFDCTPTQEDDYAYEALSLRSGGEDAVVVDSQLIACGGLGAYGFDGLFWSPNSRYFYYTTAREGAPDGCGVWQPPIRRLDAASGAVKELGGGWVSPDRSRIATWLDQALVLWDVDGGELVRLPGVDRALPLIAASWSPDGRAIAYMQAPSLCNPGAAGKSTVVRVAVADRRQSVLLETESPTFAGLAWETAGEIRLVDSDRRQWILDDHGLRAPWAP